jgi:predicted transcriptional regulator
MNQFATMSRRHRKQTTSVKDLNARLVFLYSRVNSHSDPALQALINQTKAALAVAEDRLRETRIANLNGG